MSVESSKGPRAEIENLLAEGRRFPPDPAFAAQANATAALYEEAERDFEAFWARLARERIELVRAVRDDPRVGPAVRQVVRRRRAQHQLQLRRPPRRATASATRSPTTGSASPATPGRSPTRDLQREVSKAANALKELGVEKGDRVAIYMPMIPELPIAMLACARHRRAAHGRLRRLLGRGAGRPDQRRRGEGPDHRRRRLAARQGGRPQAARRRGPGATRPRSRTSSWSRRLGRRRSTWSRAATTGGTTSWSASPTTARPSPVDSEHMLYLLYTSGTTAKPKGILHTTAGYLLGTSFTHEMIFDVKPDDVYWCAADIGWVTGHSYIVYGPLANATTGIMYEGAPDTPAWDRWWQIIEDYKVTILYCAPTAIRAFMKQGEAWPRRTTSRSLRVLGSVGEPINPEAWLWYHEHIGGGKAPDRRHLVADRDRHDPDHAAARRDDDEARLRDLPVPGHRGRRRRRRRQVRAARRGRLPRPEAAVAGDAARHLRRPGALPADLLEPLPGDVLRRRRREARRGRLLLAARPGRRRDERVRPPDLHDRGRVGAGRPPVGRRGGGGRQERRDHRPGDLRLRHPQGRAASRPRRWRCELREHVANVIGPIARPKYLLFTPDLPKTRSGKIMRRLLRDIAEGRVLGDTTTLADATVVDTIRDDSGGARTSRACPSHLPTRRARGASRRPGTRRPAAAAGHPLRRAHRGVAPGGRHGGRGPPLGRAQPARADRHHRRFLGADRRERALRPGAGPQVRRPVRPHRRAGGRDSLPAYDDGSARRTSSTRWPTTWRWTARRSVSWAPSTSTPAASRIASSSGRPRCSWPSPTP